MTTPASPFPSLARCGALVCAPMAGLTHSAFRRLVGEFGGADAIYTEMLSARTVPREDSRTTPAIRRRAVEGTVIYQLLASQPGDIAPAIEALAPLEPSAVDLNLGCPAPEVRKLGGGASLFADLDRLRQVLTELRARWTGVLLVKCRLGAPGERWRDELRERLSVFEECGVDGVTVHARFTDEKLKRRARWEEYPWVCAQTRLPVAGNGDIENVAQAGSCLERHTELSAIMLGRIAVVQPWIFAQARGAPAPADYSTVWNRMCEFVLEDFTPERAIGRLREFTEFFSRNYAFGNTLYSAVRTATTIEQARERAQAFFDNAPTLCAQPSIAGL